MGLTPPTPPTPPTRAKLAVALAVAAGTLLYTLASLVSGSYGAAFFSIPVFVGLIAGALSRTDRIFRSALWAHAIALALAVLTLREGVVCVLFSLPVTLPMTMLGAFAAVVLRKYVQARRARNATLLAALFAGAGWQALDGYVDDPARHPLHAARSTVTIQAPPARVFALLTERPLQVAPRWPWFIRIGLPMPERMTVEQPRLHGAVRFDFAHTSVFGRITRWDPPRQLGYAIQRYEIHDLPFHITRLGRSPDYGLRHERVEDWLSVKDTRYQLTPTASGGTLLERTIVWQRHLAPDAYFAWLQQTVMERGQERLLQAIARKAERGGGGTPPAVDVSQASGNARRRTWREQL